MANVDRHVPPSGSGLDWRAGSGVFVASFTVIAIAQICLFFPGYLSFDSAYQWWQARHFDISTLSPPGQILLLSALEFIARDHGAALLYVLSCAIYWICCCYLTLMQPRTRWRAAVAAFLALSPIVVIVLPHVWTDVSLAVGLLLSALLLDASTLPGLSPARQRLCLVLAGLLQIFCVLLRHNALLALPPLWWCTVLRWNGVSRYGVPAGWAFRSQLLGCILLFSFSVATYVTVPRWVAKTKADAWAIVLIWDLQAITVATGEVLIPRAISSDTTVEDLRRSFSPVSSVSLYAKSTAHWANAATGLTADQRQALVAAWLRAITTYPGSYLAHRSHVFAKTVGPKRDAEVDGTADEPIRFQFRDNPPAREFAYPTALALAQAVIRWLAQSLWASAAVWLVALTLCTVSVLSLSRRTARPHAPAIAGQERNFGASQPLRKASAKAYDPRVAAYSLLASALLYLLPLFVLMPSAELRYVLWPCVAVAASAAFALRARAAESAPTGRV